MSRHLEYQRFRYEDSEYLRMRENEVAALRHEARRLQKLAYDKGASDAEIGGGKVGGSVHRRNSLRRIGGVDTAG